KPRAREAVALLGAAGQPQDHGVAGDEGTLLGRPPTEGDDARGKPGPERPAFRVVAIEDGKVLRLLGREQARLEGPVLREARVSIEMIRGDVQAAADPRAKGAHPLELKARHL